MKTTLLSIIGMLLMGELIAGHTKVTFFSERGETFILSVNGRRVNHRPATRVYLNNLYGGRNQVKVRIQGRRGAAVITRPIFVEEGFTNEFAIAGSPRHGYVLEKVAVFGPRRGGKGRGNGHGRYKEREYFYSGDEYVRSDYGNERHRGSVRYGHGRPHRRFVNMNDLLASMSYYHFDRKKLRYAKGAIDGQLMYTRDVIRIMREFTFDDAKLDFAVYAYRSVVDPVNFYKVKKAFSFRSTARELDNRLR